MPRALVQSGRGWYARIGGKVRYLCSAKLSRQQAELVYHRLAAAILGQPAPQAAQAPAGPAPGQILTVHAMLALWLKYRAADVQAGRLSATAYAQYALSADRLSAAAGKYLPVSQVHPADVRRIYDAILASSGEDAARRAISHLRQASRFAADMGWCAPIRLGPLPALSASARQPRPWRLYTPAEIRRLLAEARRLADTADGRSRPSWQQLVAMILLALNGGYGAKELSDLPRAVVDLDRGLIDYARGKTGERHIVPLWPETVEALRVVMAQRPDDDLLFSTRQGNPWVVSEPKYDSAGVLIGKRSTDHVQERFRELAARCGLRFKGQGFYKLRHLHCTLADEAGDPHATYALAGHSLPGSKRWYVHISESRLRAVTEFIRRRLLIDDACHAADAQSDHPVRDTTRQVRHRRSGQRRPVPPAGRSAKTAGARRTSNA